MGNVLFVYERPGVRLHVQRNGWYYRSTLRLQRLDGSWTDGNNCSAETMRGATLPLMLCLDASAHRWLLDLIEGHERCEEQEARRAAC